MNGSQPSGVAMDVGEELAAHRFNRWLLGILIAGAIARVVLLAYAERESARFDYPDTHRYIQVARHIAAGLGPIDSPIVRAGTDPLYPAILSVAIFLGWEDTATIVRFGRVVNVLCSLGSIALLALIGRRLIGGRAGLIAAGILAFDPILLFFNGLVLTETLFIAIFLGGAYCVVCQKGMQHGGWSFAAGLMLGLGIITRSTSLLLPAMLFPIVVAFANDSRAIRRRAALLFILGAVGPVVPVIARNYRLFGQFVPVRTGGGASLLEAFGPWADGGPGMNRIEYPSGLAGTNEYEQDRVHREAAWNWIRENPRKSLGLAWTKLRRTWSVTLHAPGYLSPRYQLIGWLTVAPVYGLALTGAYVIRKQPLVLMLLIAPGVYFSLVHMVFVGSVRYRLPAMPFIFLLAGTAIDHWRRRAEGVGTSRG